ncbi:Copia protein, partial [Mucuna pruriens]
MILQWFMSSSMLMTLLLQRKYIRDLLAKTNMAEAKYISSPMAAICKLSKEGFEPFQDDTLYRSVLTKFANSCLNLLKHTGPLLNASLLHQRTTSWGLHFKPASPHSPLSLETYCNTDWTSDVGNRCSTSGACWCKKQTVVACSSIEAEYRSLALAATEVLWVQTLLSELGVCHSVLRIHCDNMSTVALAHKPSLTCSHQAHGVLSKQLLVQHIPATDQCADILTKALSPTGFTTFHSKLKGSINTQKKNSPPLKRPSSSVDFDKSTGKSSGTGDIFNLLCFYDDNQNFSTEPPSSWATFD